jgi:hypothetical protein
VSALAFLSTPEPAGPGVVELRGAVDVFGAAAGERHVWLTDRRALVVVFGGPVRPVVERARAAGLRAYDVSAAYVAVPVEGETLLRRLTDVDPATFPAAGPVARDVPAVLLREADEWYLALVPRELADHVREVVLDLDQGLA